MLKYVPFFYLVEFLLNSPNLCAYGIHVSNILYLNEYIVFLENYEQKTNTFKGQAQGKRTMPDILPDFIYPHLFCHLRLSLDSPVEQSGENWSTRRNWILLITYV